MNLRIAVKVAREPHRYRGRTRARAARRLSLWAPWWAGCAACDQRGPNCRHDCGVMVDLMASLDEMRRMP